MLFNLVKLNKLAIFFRFIIRSMRDSKFGLNTGYQTSVDNTKVIVTLLPPSRYINRLASGIINFFFVFLIFHKNYS